MALPDQVMPTGNLPFTVVSVPRAVMCTERIDYSGFSGNIEKLTIGSKLYDVYDHHLGFIIFAS